MRLQKKQELHYLGGGFKYFLILPVLGEMIQVEEHIFQMGWFNHQLVVNHINYISIYIYMGVSKNNGTPKSSILIGFSIIFTIHFGVPLFLETSIWHRYLLQDHLNQVFFWEHFPVKKTNIPTEGLEAEIFNSTELDLSHLLVTKMVFGGFFFEAENRPKHKMVGNVKPHLGLFL